MIDLLPVDLIGNPSRSDARLAFVRDGLERVRVRWEPARDLAWLCDACGAQETPSCPHTFATGVRLAESLLGLTVGAIEHTPQKETNA